MKLLLGKKVKDFSCLIINNDLIINSILVLSIKGIRHFILFHEYTLIIINEKCLKRVA